MGDACTPLESQRLIIIAACISGRFGRGRPQEHREKVMKTHPALLLVEAATYLHSLSLHALADPTGLKIMKCLS